MTEIKKVPQMSDIADPNHPLRQPDPVTYKIVRFFRDDRNPETVKIGLTLAEAQAHCQRGDTHGDGWFDGYQEEK
jgi:hypothetical protein